jgi:hypothetical protein
MANFIKIFDTVSFVPVEKPTKEQQDNFFAQNQAGRPLVVKIAATHSGLITRNNGFYLPDKMRKGSASFTSQYNKPIQIHHDDEADPVGRVVRAEYVDSSGTLAEKVVNKIKNFVAPQNSFQDFIDGKMPFIQSVNYICDFLNKKDSLLDDPDYQGLGYIKLTAQISDQEAAQKILDGRYLTGSVGLTTDAAVCSVCKLDWTDEGPCDHRPGKLVDGAKSFLILGNLTYDEYSFVNTPADRHSRILEINVNGVLDSYKMDDSVGRSIAVNIITDNINSEQQEESMDIKAVVGKFIDETKARFSILGDEFFTQFVTSLEDATVAGKWLAHDAILPVELELFFDKSALTKVHDLATPAEKLAAVKVIRPFMEETAVTKLVDDKYENAEKLIDALNTSEWTDYAESEDEAIATYLTAHPEDAKLSAAQRKRLPGSSFCGPNKSFPVPDATHVDSARKLVLLATASAALKSNVLSSIARKAVSFQPVVVPPKVETPPVADSVCKCADSHKTELDKLNAQIADLTAKNTELAKTLDGIKEASEKTLNDVRTELKLTQDDLVQMSDQLFTIKSEATSYLVDKLVTFSILSGEVIEDEAVFRTGLNNLTDEGLKEKLTTVTAKVDMKKITDSINSGLARNPTGTITDPTLNHDKKKQYDSATLKKIEEQYATIKFGGNSQWGRGPIAAEKFKQDMQSRGLLPVG